MADYNEDILGKWLNNNLTDEEKKLLEADEHFAAYHKIIASTENLALPDFDEEKLWNKLKSNRSKKTRTIPLYRYAIAASLLILIGSFSILYLSNQKIVTTGYGEFVDITLPDGSEIQMNANSEVRYNTWLYRQRRMIRLTGDAFFDVEPGKRFITKTDHGQVEVLGTLYRVKSTKAVFRVNCLEGSVRVTDTGFQQVLRPGDLVTKTNGIWEVNNQPVQFRDPSRMTYRNVQLQEVLEGLTNQFGVTFVIHQSVDLSQRFSGSIPKDELSNALSLVFDPLEIQYTVDGQQISLRVEN